LISEEKALAAGLVRIATAIDSQIHEALTARPEQSTYHELLREALAFPKTFRSQVSHFVSDVLATSDEDAVDSLRPVRAQLSLLHMSLSALTAAVSWANQYTAIAWWVKHRLAALELDRYTVVLTPGPIGDFQIAISSNASNELTRLARAGIVTEVQPNIESLERIRILRVPADDGSSALWHPLILGHELAHLKYDIARIELWLSEQSADDLGELASDAVVLAQSKGREVPSPWYQSLTYWLSEIACDTALSHQYGAEGLDSLQIHLAIHALSRDSSTHPSPDLRLAIQRATSDGDLTSHRPRVSSQDDPSRRRSAALTFAIMCREWVKGELADALGGANTVSNDSADDAYTSLCSDLTPPSQRWPREALAESPGSIESGLVRALWRRQTDLVSDNDSPVTDFEEKIKASLRDLDRIEHAVDSLQFAARFETQRRAVNTAQKDAIANVLWVTRHGVKSIPTDMSGDPAHDLRLGRFFVVFKRNEIASLSALGGRENVRAMQSAVEVGWGQTFVLHPGELVLAATFETLRVDDDCCAQVLSRSSLGRMGLLSATAVQVQPGFNTTTAGRDLTQIRG